MLFLRCMFPRTLACLSASFAACIFFLPSQSFASTSSISPQADGFTIQIVNGAETVNYQWQAPSLGSLYTSGTVTVTDSLNGATAQSQMTFTSKLDWVGASRGLQNITVNQTTGATTLTYANSSGVIHLTVSPVVDGLFAGLHFVADQAGLQDIYLGQLPPSLPSQPISVPYYSQAVNYLTSANLFENSFFDPFSSNATTLATTGVPETFYGPNENGAHNVLNDVWKIGVSQNIDNVLPYPEHAASPYMSALAGRLMLDVRNTTPFTTIASEMSNLADYGIHHCSMIVGTWQANGYDNALPSQYPANASLGGDTGIEAVSSAAKAASCLFALHENYTDYYPNYPAYTASATMRNTDGTQMAAWTNPVTNITAFATKPGLFVPNASGQSPSIHASYGTTAAFLDVNSSAMPWWRADRDPSAAGNNAFSTYSTASIALWAYERQLIGGPVFGEGKYHWFWSGLLDGVEAQFGSESSPITNGTQAPLFVDFDLTRIHPLQVNYGMGYYTRWLPPGTLNTAALDAYRMQEVIFGHEPYLADNLWMSVPRALLEQDLVGPTAARYTQQTPNAIAYLVDNAWVDASTAAKIGNFTVAQVTYPNGDTLVANSAAPLLSWNGLTIPRYGWAARGSNYLAYTALVNNQIADYSQTPQAIYANARNQVDIVAENTVATPSVTRFQQTGPRVFQIQMSWAINTAVPSSSYQDFVHFVSSTAPAGSNTLTGVVSGGITSPSSTWTVGQQITDKVLTYWLPSTMADGVYDVRAGLYQGAQRAVLLGNDDGNLRYTVGQITVANQGANITFTPKGFTLANPDPRLNSAGSTVNFGTIATDGMVMIQQVSGSNGSLLQLSAYPRSRDVVIQINASTIAEPSAITCDNGAVLTPAIANNYWSVDLRGHKYCTWPGSL